MRSDIFVNPFRFNRGTKRKFVGMMLEALKKSWDS